MRSARFDLALESGAFVVPPAGDVLVFAPRHEDSLHSLPRDRTVVLTGFKPDHDHFQRQGYRTETGAPVAAIICLPRAKAEALALIARAFTLLPGGAPVLVDGQKTDGVDSVMKQAQKARLSVGPVLSKAHGKAFGLVAGPVPAGWAAAPRQIDGGFTTLPGVFSADGPDPGSVLLAGVLPGAIKGHVADLGAGWGYLARAILARAGVKSLDLVEADRAALDCARLNIADPRAAFHWADATVFKPQRLWDAVVMNPPFHSGRSADPDLGIAFLRSAQRGLAPSGQLWMVANRHLPYDKPLREMFRTVEYLGGNGVFRLTRAAVPIRAR